MKEKLDYIFVIIIILAVVLIDIGLFLKEDKTEYIKELEEKVNNYEQGKYENYCIEDALKQQEGSYEL